MKKLISIVMAAVMLLALTCTASAADTVKLSTQNLAVNGQAVTCEKYNINGSNYFKLRDLAYALNGTGSQFAVGYDAASNTVTITTGAAYTANGSELQAGADKSSTARASSQTILINGKAVSNLSVYNIGGNNYFKLRDLGDAIGFAVGYNDATRTATVTASVTASGSVSGTPTVSSARFVGMWEYDEYFLGYNLKSDGTCTVDDGVTGTVPGTWVASGSSVTVYENGAVGVLLTLSGDSLVDEAGDTLSRVSSYTFESGKLLASAPASAADFVGVWEYGQYDGGYTLKADGTGSITWANEGTTAATWKYANSMATVYVNGEWYADLAINSVGIMFDDENDILYSVPAFSF